MQEAAGAGIRGHYSQRPDGVCPVGAVEALAEVQVGIVDEAGDGSLHLAQHTREAVEPHGRAGRLPREVLEPELLHHVGLEPVRGLSDMAVLHYLGTVLLEDQELWAGAVLLHRPHALGESKGREIGKED